MTIEEAILERIRALPPDEQAEVLALADSLSKRAKPQAPLRNPKGLWADFDFSISNDDIAELRQEMWATFPREDI